MGDEITAGELGEVLRVYGVEPAEKDIEVVKKALGIWQRHSELSEDREGGYYGWSRGRSAYLFKHNILVYRLRDFNLVVSFQIGKGAGRVPELSVEVDPDRRETVCINMEDKRPVAVPSGSFTEGAVRGVYILGKYTDAHETGDSRKEVVPYKAFLLALSKFRAQGVFNVSLERDVPSPFSLFLLLEALGAAVSEGDAVKMFESGELHRKGMNNIRLQDYSDNIYKIIGLFEKDNRRVAVLVDDSGDILAVKAEPQHALYNLLDLGNFFYKEDATGVVYCLPFDLVRVWQQVLKGAKECADYDDDGEEDTPPKGLNIKNIIRESGVAAGGDFRRVPEDSFVRGADIIKARWAAEKRRQKLKAALMAAAKARIKGGQAVELGDYSVEGDTIIYRCGEAGDQRLGVGGIPVIKLLNDAASAMGRDRYDRATRDGAQYLDTVNQLMAGENPAFGNVFNLFMTALFQKTMTRAEHNRTTDYTGRKIWLGNACAILEKDTQTKRCTINGHPVAKAELWDIIGRAVCFKDQESFDGFLVKLKSTPLRLHKQLVDGVIVKVGDLKGGSGTLERGLLRVERRGKEYYLYATERGARHRAYGGFSAISLLGSGAFATRASLYKRLLRLVKDKEAAVHLTVASISECVNALARARALLDSLVAAHKDRVVRTTARAEGKDMNGYAVRGRLRDYFVDEDSAKVWELRGWPSEPQPAEKREEKPADEAADDDDFGDDGDGEERGAEGGTPRLGQYFCIVDKAAAPLNKYDQVVARIYALLNDKSVAGEVDTLRR